MSIAQVTLSEARLRRRARALVLVTALVLLLGAALASPARAQDAGRERSDDPCAALRLRGPVDPARVGAGELLLLSPGALCGLPLVSSDVEIVVTGVMVRGTVTQVFRNPTDRLVEAVYLFPLPERSAVHHMEMRMGARRIVAVVEEKKEARRTYERARDEGRKAALVEQSRPNLFTTSVANVNPGEDVTVVLEYVEEADWRDGAFSLAFPMAFTPRYTGDDSGPDAEEDDLDRSLAGGSAGSASETRSGVRVLLRPGMALAEVACLSHDLVTVRAGDTWELRPEGGSVVADRDLRVRWRPALEHAPQAAVVAERGADGGYGMLMVFPPDLASDPDPGLPTETLFIVDVSGSMDGPSLRQARAALLAALDALRPDDTFNLLRFSDTTVRFREGFVEARGDALEEARRWVRSLEAEGGTRILPALEEGLRLVAGGSRDRSRRVIFVTDGAVSNEDAVLRVVSARIGDVRLHTLGIGHAPNAWLMRKMARLGRGVCEFVFDTDGAENRIEAFFRKLGRPVMTDLELSGLDAEPGTMYPARLPDLHAGEPLVVSFRFGKEAFGGPLSLAGRTAWGWFHEERAVLPDESGSGRDLGVATRWASARVTDLLDSLNEGADPGRVREEVIDLGRSYHLVTPYTSLVAVEEVATAEGGDAIQVRGAARLGLGTLPRGGTLDPLKRLVGGLLSLLGGLALMPFLLRGTR